MTKSISITNARKDIYKIAKEVCMVHEPALIYNASNGNNVVMISETDWNAIQETLYLNSVQGLTESILDAKAEPIEDGVEYDENEAW